MITHPYHAIHLYQRVKLWPAHTTRLRGAGENPEGEVPIGSVPTTQKGRRGRVQLALSRRELIKWHALKV